MEKEPIEYSTAIPGIVFSSDIIYATSNPALIVGENV